MIWNNRDLENLGDNIRFHRERLGYSRERFAELTNVSSRMVYNWEDGLSAPKIDRFVLICNILGQSMDSMLLPLEV